MVVFIVSYDSIHQGSRLLNINMADACFRLKREKEKKKQNKKKHFE